MASDYPALPCISTECLIHIHKLTFILSDDKDGMVSPVAERMRRYRKRRRLHLRTVPIDLSAVDIDAFVRLKILPNA